MNDLAGLEQMAQAEYERYATWAALQMFPSEKQEARPLRAALIFSGFLYLLSFAVWFLVAFLT